MSRQKTDRTGLKCINFNRKFEALNYGEEIEVCSSSENFPQHYLTLPVTLTSFIPLVVFISDSRGP